MSGKSKAATIQSRKPNKAKASSSSVVIAGDGDVSMWTPIQSAYAAQLLGSPGVKVGAPVDGSRFAEIRQYSNRFEFTADAAGEITNFLAILDPNQLKLIILEQRSSTDAHPWVNSVINLQGADYLDTAEFSDFRVAGAAISAHNLTESGNSTAVKGYPLAGQFADCDNFLDLDEYQKIKDLCRLHGFSSGVRPSDSSSMIYLPSDLNRDPLPFPGSAQPRGGAVRLTYQGASSSSSTTPFGPIAANTYSELFDLNIAYSTDDPTTGHYALDSQYNGPVEVDLGLVVADTSVTFTVDISRSITRGSGGVATQSYTVAAANSGSYSYGLRKIVDEYPGIITSIVISTSTASTNLDAQSQLSVTFDGGQYEGRDALVAGWWGAADEQTIMFDLILTVDMVPGAARAKENKPEPLKVSAQAAWPVLQHIARNQAMDSQMAQARSFAPNLRKVARDVDRALLKTDRLVGQGMNRYGNLFRLLS